MATWFAGKLLLRDRVEQGYVAIEEGRVHEAGFGPCPEKPAARGWIAPRFVNAHTHVADSFLRSRPDKPATVPELVGPGGWKHRELARADPQAMERGVRMYTDEMAAVGTQAFIDFREGGLPGVQFLRGLDDLPVEGRVLGRPLRPAYDEAEAQAILDHCDGLGLPSLRDYPHPADVQELADAAHEARKTLAMHASEARRESVEDILALDPDFLVHCTAATPGDLRRIGDEGVPVVVCPRSNAQFGLKTPLPAMLEAGIVLAVGSDNGMLADGDLRKDLAQLHAWHPDVPTEDLLRMATWNGRDLAGLATAMPPRKGQAADLVVLPDVPWEPMDAGKPGFTIAVGQVAP